nr:hypothetical protein [Tanacetum cinerariifolium]
MRIEQYFLMTDYSLWEVILNEATRKNELKARGTLLMDLLDKHQLKLNIHKDAKTLIEAIDNSLPTEWRTHTLIWRNKTDLEEQSLDDLFNRLKIYKAEVKSSFSASTSTQNITFVSSQNTDSTNKPVGAVASVSAASADIPVSALPNVDTLSNAVIYSFFASQSNSPQLDNDDLKQIDGDDLEEMDLKWQMAMLTVRARRFLQGQEGIMEQIDLPQWGLTCQRWSATNATGKGTLQESVAMTRSFRQKKNQPTMPSWHSPPQVLLVLTMRQTNDKTRLGYDNQVFTSSMFDCAKMFSSESDISMPASPKYDRYQSGEAYHVVPPQYIGTFMQPKPDLVFHDAPNVNETAHTAFNVELSPTKHDKDLSHTHMPSTPIIEDWVSDSEDESEAEPLQNDPSFVQTTEQVKTHRPYVKPVEHSIPAANHKIDIPKPKILRNSRNKKACFVCKSLTHMIKDCNYYEKKMAQTHVRNHAQRGNHQHYARMTHPNPQRHVVPTTVLTKSKLVPLTAARPVTTAVPQHHVTRLRPAKTVVTKPYSPPRRNINQRPSPKPSNFSLKVTIVKAPMFNAVKGVQGNWGNPRHVLKDKGVIDSGFSRHMTGNMSYLFEFEVINGGYVAFGGNPKGAKITGKCKIRTRKLDFDDVYFVKELKFNLFSVSQMCDVTPSIFKRH